MSKAGGLLTWDEQLPFPARRSLALTYAGLGLPLIRSATRQLLLGSAQRDLPAISVVEILVRSKPDDSALQGGCYGVGTVVGVELCEDVRDMAFYCFLGDEEFAGNVFVRVAGGIRFCPE